MVESRTICLCQCRLAFEENDYLIEQRRYCTKEVILEAAEELPAITISVEPPLLESSSELSGSSATVTLRPKDDVPSGLFRAVVEISCVPPGGTQRSSQLLVVSGNIQRDVLVTPTDVSFGPAAIGSYQQATILLKSRTGVPITVEAVEVDNPNISIERLNAPSTLSEAFSVGHRTRKQGVETSIVEILVRRSIDETERLRLRVSSIGVSHREIVE